MQAKFGIDAMTILQTVGEFLFLSSHFLKEPSSLISLLIPTCQTVVKQIKIKLFEIACDDEDTFLNNSSAWLFGGKEPST